jgi:opacity protein-like surface antigen
MHARTLYAAALAVLLASPAAASAQARGGATSYSPSSTTGPSVGGFLGYEFGSANGFALRLDGDIPFQMLSPQVRLSFVGSLGYTRFSWNVANGDVTSNIVKAVPAVRFTVPMTRELELYGDAGLGLYYYSSSFRYTYWDPFFGTTIVEQSKSGVGFMMRFGAGALFKVSPGVKLGAELGLSPYFGDVSTTDFTLMVGAMFAI